MRLVDISLEVITLSLGWLGLVFATGVSGSIAYEVTFVGIYSYIS